MRTKADLPTQSDYVDEVAVREVVAGRAHMGILREAERREVVRVMTLRGDVVADIAARREPSCTRLSAARRVQRWRRELRAAGALPQVSEMVDHEQAEPVGVAQAG